ncbi:gamma-glutamylcyclotransferase [Starkeya sp. ORNL1]|uniref:gamma-glutamylcyclotransferase n=1 Tax=Starkeya sp. ORNL1 TaxID=2709380 RepID=UPI00146456E1|nr:gamma-glutamylcyclotransferase [Starkeya sp. ORNL1]QJP17344.1 gamma-glutamylcyclotransferase [Starkeya sp. ORNL1]
MDQPVLNRSLIAAGGIDAMVARDAPDMRILSEAERAASLRATLDARPPGDVWLFGYGSLIWNPTIEAIERRTARIEGWHRAFCLSASVGRGSPENPGLVLGLDEGGDCTGVAFRIAEEVVEPELTLLWRREMLSAAYEPQWLDLLDGRGVQFARGIAFTIDRGTQHYAGGLAEEDVVRRLATACGALGSAAEYLFHTCEGLRAHGIPDPVLELLEHRVHAAQGRGDARNIVSSVETEHPRSGRLCRSK